jgi:hypothetical protein
MGKPGVASALGFTHAVCASFAQWFKVLTIVLRTQDAMLQANATVCSLLLVSKPALGFPLVQTNQAAAFTAATPATSHQWASVLIITDRAKRAFAKCQVPKAGLEPSHDSVDRCA